MLLSLRLVIVEFGIARGWLESRTAAEEVLIVGATPDAANELARKVAKEKAPPSAGIGSRCPS